MISKVKLSKIINWVIGRFCSDYQQYGIKYEDLVQIGQETYARLLSIDANTADTKLVSHIHYRIRSNYIYHKNLSNNTKINFESIEVLSEIDEWEPESYAELAEMRNKIKIALEKLPERLRYIIKATYLDEEPSKVTDIAKKLNISASRVYTLLKLSERRLKRIIDNEKIN